MRKCGKSILAILFAAILFSNLMVCAGWTRAESAQYAAVEEKSSRYGYTLDAFCVDLKLWNGARDIEWADALLDGQLYVDINFGVPFPYEINRFDWNREETESPSTFQLYLQCLGMTKFLCRAALVTGDTRYLVRAGEFIQSWAEYLRNEELSANNTKVWYDHGTALRAENLIYYLLVCEQMGYSDEQTEVLIEELLIEHAEFLSNDMYYTFKHNHGIYQDEALFYISYFLPESEQTEEWKQIARERLMGQMEYAFTSEGVHVENSSAYCIGVINLFQNIEGFLENVGDELSQRVGENLINMWRFVARLTMPNGKMAVVGDSFRQAKARIDLNSCDELEYVQSKGNSGAAPAWVAAYYPDSGYFFVNESYRKECIQDSTWLMYKAGYVSKTHKHADDLQILLYSKGHEIFIDPGMFNYMSGDVYRDYLVSPSAHNTVLVDGQTYSVTEENSHKTGLLTYEKRDGSDYVLGYNDMYPGVQIDRHIYSLNDAIVVFDDILSEEMHEYSQVFQLSEDMRVISSRKNETVLSIADTGYLVRIRQYGDVEEASVIRGGTGDAFFGYASDAQNEIHEIDTLKYDYRGSNAQFVTLITIENAQGQIKITNDEDEEQLVIHTDECGFDRNSMSMKIGEKEYPLVSRKRIHFDHYEWRIDGEELTISMPDLPENAKCNWYVIDPPRKTAIYKSDWRSENDFSWTLTDQPTLFKVYVQDQYGKRHNAIIGQWDPDRKEYCDAINQLNYVHLQDSAEQLENNKWRFTAGLEYALNFSISWYVYRNGSYYTLVGKQNENTLEFAFDEPGSYTISYYIDGYNGEREYWILPKIVIGNDISDGFPVE